MVHCRLVKKIAGEKGCIVHGGDNGRPYEKDACVCFVVVDDDFGKGHGMGFLRKWLFENLRFCVCVSVHWKTRVNDQRSWRKVKKFTLFLASLSLIHVVHHVRKCYFPLFSDGKFQCYLHHWISRKWRSIGYQFVLTVLASLARQTSRLSRWRWSLNFDYLSGAVW